MEVLVPSENWEVMYMCVKGIDFVIVSKIFLFDFGTVPTVWYCFVIVTFHSVHGHDISELLLWLMLHTNQSTHQ